MANSEDTDHTIHQESGTVKSALTICSGTIRCLEGIVKMANIVNTKETYLKEQSDQCLYSLPPQGKPFTHLILPTLPCLRRIV